MPTDRRTTRRKAEQAAPATPARFIDPGWRSSGAEMARDFNWPHREAARMVERLEAYARSDHPDGPEWSLIHDARLVLIALGFEPDRPSNEI